MSLLQETVSLISNLEENSPLLFDINKTLKFNMAISQGLDDVMNGRSIPIEDAINNVKQRWQEHLTQ